MGSSVKEILVFSANFRVKMRDLYGSEVWLTVQAPCLEIAVIKAHKLRQLKLPKDWREKFGVTVNKETLKGLYEPVIMSDDFGYENGAVATGGGDPSVIAAMQKSIETLKLVNAQTLDMIQKVIKDVGVISDNVPKKNKGGRPKGYSPLKGKTKKVETNVESAEVKPETVQV